MRGIILLLGSPSDERGELLSVARERCERAILEYRRHRGFKILPTGGFGTHFNTTDKPHATYLRAYLIAHGIPQDDILGFAESRNTIEDARLSYPLVKESGVSRAIVVTSDYHGARAEYVFRRAFPDIQLCFSLCTTDRDNCDLDLAALEAHERSALAKLRQKDR
jgi:uncharacterized SAM-binding protein YcdF (DUF218 family)